MNGGDETGRKLIGGRLREARTTLGFSQISASAAVGIGRSSLSEIEGGRRNVTGVELRRLSHLYRRSVDWLLGEDDDPQDDPALLKAVAPLNSKDRELLLTFARFLKHQKGKRQ